MVACLVSLPCSPVTEAVVLQLLSTSETSLTSKESSQLSCSLKFFWPSLKLLHTLEKRKRHNTILIHFFYVVVAKFIIASIHSLPQQAPSRMRL